MTERLKNFVGGKWEEGNSDRKIRDINPAETSQVLAEGQEATREQVRRAIEAAKNVFPMWKGTPMPRRAQILSRVLELLRREAESIARIISLENGKTLKEARAEISSAVKEMDFQIGQGRRALGEVHPSETEGVFCYHTRAPLGVASVICPWNFPLNVPCRKVTPALIAGNTVVVKSATLTPLVGTRLIQLYEQAGIPAGVINHVIGPGGTVGEEMVTNEDVRAISFTGSTKVGKAIARSASDGLKKVQLEMGGKNALVILEDADLEEAANSALIAGYSCAGQWCTSTSRVLIAGAVEKGFTDVLVEKVKRLRVGNGLDENTDMGPVVDESQLRSILDYIEEGKRAGARLLTGGKRLESDLHRRGFFIEPTIFSSVSPEMRIFNEEIFGPVLCISTFSTLDEALELLNRVPYGLSASLYTRDLSSAQRFAAEAEVGLLHINLHTALKEPQLPFGGVKESGYGLPEAGSSGIEFFTEHRAVYIRS